MLGSFEVRTDDGVLAEVPGARLRGLLIALALEPGHAVPKATLVDWIWGERPPSDAANALQRLASRRRKALPEGLIEGQTDGYRLTVEPDAVDAVRFERLVGQARTDEDPRRVRLLREALALWRGAAMQGVGLTDSAAFDAAVTRLEGLRLASASIRSGAAGGEPAVDLGLPLLLVRRGREARAERVPCERGERGVVVPERAAHGGQVVVDVPAEVGGVVAVHRDEQARVQHPGQHVVAERADHPQRHVGQRADGQRDLLVAQPGDEVRVLHRPDP